MDFIPENKLLKFRSDTFVKIRKMYNLDKTGQMGEAIDLLENWLKKQGHLLKKDYSREYLERAIIFHKGSVERAKIHIDNLSSFKTLMPIYFDKYNAKQDFEYVKKTYNSVFLPKMTEDNYRVFAVKIWNDEYTRNMIVDFYKLGALMCEYAAANDYFVGIIVVLDYRDIKLSKFVSSIDLVHLNQALTVLMKGYMYRVREIHFLTSSKTIDMLLTIVKKILTAKLSNRLYVHTELDSLYEYVPKEILPSELNGDEQSIAVLFDELLDVLSTEENVDYMTEILTKAGVDKSYKHLTELNEICTGLNGTFRTLSLD